MKVRKPTQLLKLYLAKHYAKFYSKDIFVGVSGTVGKSTTVQACKAVLLQKFTTLISDPNLASSVGIPTALLKLSPKIKKVVLEMGLDSKESVDSYLTLIQPKTVIVSKISYINSEVLGGLNNILEEVGKLVSQVGSNGYAILNFDDPNSRKLAKMCPGQVVYFGTDQQNCTLWAGNIKIEDFKTSFELNLGVERVKVNLPLLGIHQVYCALAAATLGVINNIPLTKIKLSLESLEVLDHRMQVSIGPNNSTILDDTISCTCADLDAAIDTLLNLNARRRILVLGEMRGLGKYSEDLHRQVAQKIFKEKIDMCFLGQGEAEIIALELKSLGYWDERVSYNLQSGQIVSKLLKTLGKGDVVLIKGDHSLRFDEIVKRIAKKN